MALDRTAIQTQIARLPTRHRVALRAALMGCDDEDIARLLDIPVESVQTTVRVAVAKLTNLLADGRGPESVPPC